MSERATTYPVELLKEMPTEVLEGWDERIGDKIESLEAEREKIRAELDERN